MAKKNKRKLPGAPKEPDFKKKAKRAKKNADVWFDGEYAGQLPNFSDLYESVMNEMGNKN